MEPPLAVHVTTFVIFVLMFCFSVQQIAISSMTNIVFLVYRFFVTLSILFECINLMILFSYYQGLDTYLTSQIITMNCLVWCNQIWGSWIVYKFGMVTSDALWKQITSNKDIAPKWFRYIFAFIMGSNASVMILCASIALGTQKLWSIWFRALYFDFVCVSTGIIFIIALLKIRQGLHRVVRKFQKQVSNSLVLGSKTSTHSKSDVENGRVPRASSNITVSEHTKKQIRKLTGAKHRLEIMICILVIFIPATLYGTYGLFNDPEYGEPLNTPIWISTGSFINHFGFVFLYLSCALAWLYKNSKFCIKFDAESCYSIICIEKFHFIGFDKLSKCLYNCCPKNSTNIHEENSTDEDGSGSGKQNSNNTALLSAPSNPTTLGTPKRSQEEMKTENENNVINPKKLNNVSTNSNSVPQSDKSDKDNSSINNQVKTTSSQQSTVSQGTDNYTSHLDNIINKDNKNEKLNTLPRLNNPTSEEINDNNDNSNDNNNNNNNSNPHIIPHSEVILKNNQFMSTPNLGLDNLGDDDENDENDRPQTPTQRHIESTHTNNSSMQVGLSEKAIGRDLDRITWDGRKKSKREVAKPRKFTKEEKEQRYNIDVVPINVETKSVAKFSKLPPKQRTFDVAGEGFYEATALEKEYDIFKTSVHLDDPIDVSEPVTLVIYQYEHVLCTQPQKYKDSTVDIIESMETKQIALSFGGEIRLEQLHEHLNKVFEKKKVNENDEDTKANENDSEQAMCFVLTDEYSETIYKVLERVSLVQYFVSINPHSQNRNGKAKKLSHVIGWDHKLMKETDHKKHLIILKLIQFLRREHDHVLFVSHDQEICEQLNKNNMCRTYYVGTKGMTDDDFQKIEEEHF